ncbi:MAG: sigma factor, partial [Sciscionella sp.]
MTEPVSARRTTYRNNVDSVVAERVPAAPPAKGTRTPRDGVRPTRSQLVRVGDVPDFGAGSALDTTTGIAFGPDQPDGLFDGDGRNADAVEAGIVALWTRYGEQRERELRDRLVLHYAPLVKYVAGRVGTGLPAHVDVADLIQSGIFGLVDAIERFEPE